MLQLVGGQWQKLAGASVDVRRGHGLVEDSHDKSHVTLSVGQSEKVDVVATGGAIAVSGRGELPRVLGANGRPLADTADKEAAKAAAKAAKAADKAAKDATKATSDAANGSGKSGLGSVNGGPGQYGSGDSGGHGNSRSGGDGGNSGKSRGRGKGGGD